QNKLYSSVYILGSGLAISLVMVLTLIYYIKIAPVYPEIHRDRTLVYKDIIVDYLKEESRRSYFVSYEAVKNYFYPLQSVEAVSAIGSIGESFLELPATKERVSVQVKHTDAAFWQVFGFRFVDGKPFTEEEFQAAIRSAVICESMAKKLFGTSQAEGKFFFIRLRRIPGEWGGEKCIVCYSGHFCPDLGPIYYFSRRYGELDGRRNGEITGLYAGSLCQ
ncbi:MAG: ABC transporter permease, partial [Bacteroides sp.]|nr:ABC transporter permease [Bacteroides sp.]